MRKIAFLTKHGKEKVIRPVLELGLDWCIQLVKGYDTDLLGTFSRDIPRQANQLDTARLKAKIAIELSGLDSGMASEGAFNPDPVSGTVLMDRELVIWLDAVRGVEVVGEAVAPSNFQSASCNTWRQLKAFAKVALFPYQGLILLCEDGDLQSIRKNLKSEAELKAAFYMLKKKYGSGFVKVEYDLRAFANPTRMKVIRSAAQNLVQKIRSLCPSCKMPGFAISETRRGLPCGVCEAPTMGPSAYISVCVHCGHKESIPVESSHADASICPNCNP